MTEQEWMECHKPRPMVEYLRFKKGVRKLRLFTVACFRCLGHGLSHEERLAVESAEYLAETRMEIARRSLRAAKVDAGAALAALWGAIATRQPTASLQASLFREIIGNPFRPMTINPNWLTPTVINLATIAYEERTLPSRELDTTHLCILADALEETGCGTQDILGHLRSQGPHFLGCHVLDLIFSVRNENGQAG